MNTLLAFYIRATEVDGTDVHAVNSLGESHPHTSGLLQCCNDSLSQSGLQGFDNRKI
jgi:hypothetical protein